MQIEHPKAIECAEKARTLILSEYKVPITNDEVAYLALHIQRVTAESGTKQKD